jgi:hypothetical protein
VKYHAVILPAAKDDSGSNRRSTIVGRAYSSIPLGS